MFKVHRQCKDWDDDEIGKRRPPLTTGNSTWPTTLLRSPLSYWHVLSLVDVQGWRVPHSHQAPGWHYPSLYSIKRLHFAQRRIYSIRFQQLDIHHKMFGWIEINCCFDVLSIEFSETRILKATPFTQLLVGTFGCLCFNINACHAYPIFFLE
jgi:hypothetical protein